VVSISYDDFARVDLRVGVVTHVEAFERARTPTYKIRVDFGPEIGEKWSSAQARREYAEGDLLGRQVIAVVNLAPKNIAGFLSEVLLLGVPMDDGSLSLLEPSRRPARVGGRVY
jgi:tRNA-binding protein